MPHVLVTGTDVTSRLGGIGVVMEGYLSALGSAGIPYTHVATYHPGQKHGRWLPWLRALPGIWRISRERRAAGFRAVVFSHAGDGVSLLRESLVLWIARAAGAKTLMQVHSPRVDSYLDGAIERWLFKAAVRPANHVGVLTPWWKERLLGARVRRPISVIPNPLPSAMEAVARMARLPRVADGTLRVLTMARLVKGKGVDVVVRAMARLTEGVRLTVAGDGAERPALEALAREVGLERRAEFLGWVSGDLKTRLLEESDVFCLPSTYDAFPMSMVEAMVYGLPVVAVAWGGIPDLVANGETGVLAEAPEPRAIARALEGLRDPAKREAMGRRAKDRILEISASEAVGARIRAVVDGL